MPVWKVLFIGVFACVCLALTSAPIRMTGLLTRLLNPFLRR